MATNFVYEGETIPCLESDLVQPTRTGELVISGDPVVAGSLVGIALKSASASTDTINIATCGVWNVPVVGTNGSNSAVAFGDRLYINSSTAVISKTTSGHVAFGIALGAVTGGATTTIPVKVCGAGL